MPSINGVVSCRKTYSSQYNLLITESPYVDMLLYYTKLRYGLSQFIAN